MKRHRENLKVAEDSRSGTDEGMGRETAQSELDSPPNHHLSLHKQETTPTEVLIIERID